MKNEDTFRRGRETGCVISWYTSSPSLSNALCLYCGQSVIQPDAPPSDKEHLIARNFVPSGSMGNQSFNFLFRACRACNARKADAERHVSSVTLFNSPSRAVDSRADISAVRKGRADFHPKKRGVLIQNSHEEWKLDLPHPLMKLSFAGTRPPQVDMSSAGEFAFCHIQGLFALITTNDFRDPSRMNLLPQDQFVWYDMYSHQDWGNPQIVELSQRVKDWECAANVNSADGYFKAIMRQHESGWFWALEWNKQLRLVGGICRHQMPIFKNLPGEKWIPTPNGRMRREIPIDPTIDLLFEGQVLNENPGSPSLICPATVSNLPGNQR